LVEKLFNEEAASFVMPLKSSKMVSQASVLDEEVYLTSKIK
jgi:hypothetical protein